MKKGTVLFLAVALCILAGAALADDYGEAVIDAGNGYKVHLREEPTSASASMGLFFTGTEVTLKSDPRSEWVEVKIGRERGWMMSAYLKTGVRAEHVAPRFWEGEVQANKYARMRKGPSTEYEFIRNVNDGERLKIMGETDEGWYYVLHKGDAGFISKNLIYTRGSDGGIAPEYDPAYVAPPETKPVPAMNWQTAYRRFLLEIDDAAYTYSLIYVNDDDIPELAINSDTAAAACRILTYADGQVDVLTTRRTGYTYIPRGNRLCNSDGTMDQYFDDVYEIKDGRWVPVARGEYYGYLSGWNEILKRYVCRYYIWNGQPTDIGQYMISLGRVYDSSRAASVDGGISWQDMLSKLYQMH